MNRISELARVMQGVSLVVRAGAKYRIPPCVSSATIPTPFSSSSAQQTPTESNLNNQDYRFSSSSASREDPSATAAAATAQQQPAFYFDSFQKPFEPSTVSEASSAVNSTLQDKSHTIVAQSAEKSAETSTQTAAASAALAQQSTGIATAQDQDETTEKFLDETIVADKAPISAAVEAKNAAAASAGRRTAAIKEFREYDIPSTPMRRLFGFSKLGFQLVYGTIVSWTKSKLGLLPAGAATATAVAKAAEEAYDPLAEKVHKYAYNFDKFPAPPVLPETAALKRRQAESEALAAKASQATASASGVAQQQQQPRAAAPVASAAAPQPQRQQSDFRRALMNEDNAERLASTLCRMRGAALKLGQMFSILDEKMLPEPVLRALERVRNQADIMPRKQLEKQLVQELGEGWQEKYFSEFEMLPIAAASIGQVHRAVLKDGTEVAVKVQYPGVAESIDSDIKNVMRLVNLVGVAPGGAFLDSSIGQARKELKLECDYTNEALNQKRFRQLIQEAGLGDKLFVPRVFDHVSTKRVLVTEMIPASAQSIEQLANTASQEERNYVAELLLRLCLKELFEFKFMQTDPNWSNFYYDSTTKKLYLLDFGACLEFPKTFVDEYIRVVWASAHNDKATIIDASRKMGFLTGEETQIMNDAHAEAVIIVGDPFSKKGTYHFESQLMTDRVKTVIPTMLKHRLTPPPPVTYSLHRKLSGSFLLCFKLKANFDARSIMEDVVRKYRFEPQNSSYTLPL